MCFHRRLLTTAFLKTTSTVNGDLSASVTIIDYCEFGEK